ncbi:MAG: MFS transporter [Spirochaetales bacterium]|nr:MFS transporter [Spirochaetales bacterium]
MEEKKIGNVFAGRNFRLVFFGALVSELGALLYSFAVSFYILEISGNNAFLQGLYLALCGIAMLLFTPVGGVMGDRFNKAKIMFICDYIKGSMIILATVLMLIFQKPNAHIAILFILGILGNAVSGIFNPASGALLPHIVEEDRLQQANAYFTIKSSLESILGVILAGVLYATLPIYTLFFFVGICFVLSGVSEMFIRYDHRPSEEQLTLKLAVSDMRDGLVYLKSQKAILSILAAILFINFFFSPITGNFLPFFVRTDLATASSYLFDNVLTPELWSSVVSMCFGISSLLGAAILSAIKQPDKCGHKVALRIGLIACLMIVWTLSYWYLVDCGVSINAFLITLCVGTLVMGYLISYINIPISTAIMKVVDKEKLSKVTSITSIGSQGMIPLASVLAGVILQSLGSTTLLLFCSLGFTVTAVLMLLSKSVRDL